MITSRLSALAVAAIAGCIALASSRTEAQWWRSAPKDFEDCADRAEKAKSKEEKTSQLADCKSLPAADEPAPRPLYEPSVRRLVGEEGTDDER